MKTVYVVSGKYFFEDLGDAIESAKAQLFTKCRRKNVKYPQFSMKDNGAFVTIKATYQDLGNESYIGTKSIRIRPMGVQSTNNAIMSKAYDNFTL